jgi:hypothetical protein
MKRRRLRRGGLIPIAAAVALSARAEVADYLYRLSDFSGPVLYELPRMAVDRESGELIVAGAETVRIFGPTGMAVHEFEHDAESLGALHDIAALAGGEMLLLTRSWMPSDEPNPTLLTRCDFRGKPKETLAITGLPEGWTDFAPEVLRIRAGRRYVASLNGRKVAEIDPAGAFVEGWDLGRLLGAGGARGTDLDLGGFDVDPAGRFVVTAPVLGFGYRVAPGGQVESFGNSGSARGAMGIAKGVAVSDDGWILVADILNQLVLVFDERLEFAGDFPSRRGGPEHLAGPATLAAAPDGRVFVGEIGERGIAVFRLSRAEKDP